MRVYRSPPHFVATLHVVKSLLWTRVPSGRSGVIDHTKCRRLTTLSDALQKPAHDPQRISQQRTVGGMANVSFYGGGIGSEMEAASLKKAKANFS
jgi:hypothetical protein